MKRTGNVFFWIMVIIAAPCVIGQSLGGETLYAQSSAELMVRHAIEISREDSMDPAHIERAMAFLYAAQALDDQSDWIAEEMLRVGSGNCYSGADYTAQLNWAMDRYLKNRPDLELASSVVGCLLEQVNSRPEREAVLETLIQKYSRQHPVFTSDLNTQLAFLKIEKADIESAGTLFMRAYALNPYNQLASQKILEMTTADDASADISLQLIDTRMRLDIDPYNLNAAETYAALLQQNRLYDLAQQAYEYLSKVGQTQYPNQILPDSILYHWLSCCYLGPRLETKCLEIAERYRSQSRFDLRLEAFAGRSMIKLGQAAQGRQRLEAAGEKAETLLSVETTGKPVTEEDLAWFYSFVFSQKDKALAWSNIAIEKAPDRKPAKSLFAYVLAQNDQVELAREYMLSEDDDDPVNTLTKAIIALKEDNKQQAISYLRHIAGLSTAPFIAEKAKEMLDQQGADVVPEIAREAIRAELSNQYSNAIVPKFMPASERLTAKLLFNGSEFLYNSDFQPRLIIGNNGQGPLVIDDGAFFSGRIHVNAITEGDLAVELPGLLSKRFRPGRPLAKGEQLTVPLELKTGKLRKLLLTYPQAEVNIRFTVYLDPVVTKEGLVENRVEQLAPVRASIRRKQTGMTRDFLMQRLDTLSQGRQGQKLQSASLFAGLLAEQKAMASKQASYDYIRVEPRLITDAVRKSLLDDDWKVRVQALSSLISVSTILDGSILNEVAQNLNHDKWPVRLMALYLVAQSQSETFAKVLDWTAENDSSQIVRQMAIALGGQVKVHPENPEGVQ